MATRRCLISHDRQCLEACLVSYFIVNVFVSRSSTWEHVTIERVLEVELQSALRSEMHLRDHR